MDLDGAVDAITQEDAWAVISAYFEEKGLVRQQLDSFDEFIQITMQELVDDTGGIEVTPERQFGVGEDVDAPLEKYKIEFGQVWVSRPTTTESDNSTTQMTPQEARLRNLTYASPLYVDVLSTNIKADAAADGAAADGGEAAEGVRIGEHEDAEKEFIGYVPIMLRSDFCMLSKLRDKELIDLGECIYDQGGYFIINGSEKALVAQERLANNHVYAFRKKQPSKFSWVVESRSHIERGARPTSTMCVVRRRLRAGRRRRRRRRRPVSSFLTPPPLPGTCKCTTRPAAGSTRAGRSGRHCRTSASTSPWW